MTEEAWIQPLRRRLEAGFAELSTRVRGRLPSSMHRTDFSSWEFCALSSNFQVEHADVVIVWSFSVWRRSAWLEVVADAIKEQGETVLEYAWKERIGLDSPSHRLEELASGYFAKCQDSIDELIRILTPHEYGGQGS